MARFSPLRAAWCNGVLPTCVHRIDVAARGNHQLDHFDDVALDLFRGRGLGQTKVHVSVPAVPAQASVSGILEIQGIDPVDLHRGHHGRRSVRHREPQIGAGRRERPHDGNLAVAGGEIERCGADDVGAEPVVGALAPRTRCLRDPDVRVRPVCQQRLDKVEIAPQHGGVQRGKSGARGVGFRALIQEHSCDLHLVLESGDREGAPADRRGVVRVRPGREEQPRRFRVPLLGHEQQRREATLLAFFDVPSLDVLFETQPVAGAPPGQIDLARAHARAGLEVRSGLDQRPHDARVSIGRGPHQRRLIVRRLLGVDVGSMGQQSSHGLHATRTRRRHQRRLTRHVGGVGVRTRGQQRRHEGRVLVAAGQPERCHAEVVRHLHIGAGRNQQIGRVHVVPIGRPMQRGRAVGLRGVHSGPLFQQRLDGGRVSIPGRVRQRRISPGGRAGDYGEADKQQRRPHEVLLEVLRAHCAPPEHRQPWTNVVCVSAFCGADS